MESFSILKSRDREGDVEQGFTYSRSSDFCGLGAQNRRGGQYKVTSMTCECVRGYSYKGDLEG